MPICQAAAGLVQPYLMASTQPSNYFILPTTTALPYSEGLVSSPIPYPVPDTIQPSAVPIQSANDEMVRQFENTTFFSLPTS